jgi:rhodanese-related sulfurtransferase
MPRTIDRVEVLRLLERGTQLIDVMPPREYRDRHLPGAINIPLKRLTAESSAALRCDQPVVVYCWDYQ